MAFCVVGHVPNASSCTCLSNTPPLMMYHAAWKRCSRPGLGSRTHDAVTFRPHACLGAGHVGVYWRGGQLLQRVTAPGIHMRMPFLDSYEAIQITMQTDKVTDILCGTKGGVNIMFGKIEVCDAACRVGSRIMHGALQREANLCKRACACTAPCIHMSTHACLKNSTCMPAPKPGLSLCTDGARQAAS